MSAYSMLRSFAFVSVIACGLMTATWSSARNLGESHDNDRGDVIWINTGHR
jgi:hypothetical protein